jgi:hypothetical protein
MVSRDGQAAGLGSSNCFAPLPMSDRGDGWALLPQQAAPISTDRRRTPLRTKARTDLPWALAQACLKHGNAAEVVSLHRHRFG